MSEVTDYLKTVASTMPARTDFRYNTYEALVLDQGQHWRPEVEVRVSGPIKECFTNAWHDANLHGWRYVEGYAMSIIPVQHAWCVDHNGKVIETTWPDPGSEYFGIALDTRWVGEVAAETGYWGVLGNDWLRKGTLLRHGVPLGVLT